MDSGFETIAGQTILPDIPINALPDEIKLRYILTEIYLFTPTDFKIEQGNTLPYQLRRGKRELGTESKDNRVDQIFKIRFLYGAVEFVMTGYCYSYCSKWYSNSF
jgi:hypothetical protein